MTALLLLQGLAFALLALGGVARFMPGRVGMLAGGLGLIGLAAALVAPDVTLQAGLPFRIDGLSTVVLAALFLQGGGPAVLGALVLAVLAGDGVGLALFLAGAVAARGVAQPAFQERGLFRALPAPWADGLAGMGCLVVALLLLTWPDPGFAAVRSAPPEGLRGVLILAATLGAAALLPGGPIAVYVIARFLLGLAGPVTPGWWGVPVLLLGAAVAVLGARRAAASEDLAAAGADAGQAALGVVIIGLGAALLARGADLPPLAALAVAGALFQLLGLALWGALIGLCAAAIRDGVGGTGLARQGGLLRLAPVTGLALLAALLSMAALPLSTGFAGVWVVLQALLGVGRAGGVGGVLLAAGAAAALGLAMALLAAAAVRLAGVVLVGVPRTAKAAAFAEPGPHVRLAVAALAAALLLLGVCPFLGMMLVRPGVRLLAGADAAGMGPWMLAGAADGPGYAAPGIAGAMVLAVAMAAWGMRGAVAAAPPWRGGFAEEGAARGNTWPLVLWPGWRAWRPVWTMPASLMALALVLAAAVGWAAR